MRFQLTKVERLDARYPGLSDDVRKWFSQGISAEKVRPLILAKYQLSLSRTPIALFRAQCWVPEQELLREKRIAALAALQVAQEQEVKTSMVFSSVPGETR